MHSKQRGFTLIELMVAMAVAGILAATAYPSFAGPLFKARRTDGITALLQLQMSQERWRANHGNYASLTQLKVNATSIMGYYQLSVADPTATGFAVSAAGTGSQAGDSACKVLRITVADGNANFTSGADERTRNDSADNKRCWNL